VTPVTTLAGKTVALFGLGGSGLATALALKAGGARVIACDDSPAAMAQAEGQGIETGDLRNAAWSRFAALILSPGVPLTHPEPHWSVKLAKAASVEIIGDIELFCRERAKLAPDAPFIAITGTNGKSTTTALIAHILREAGGDVQMGGNIGTAILSLEPPANDRVHVIEMSSFQIDLTPSLKPTIGVLLNISPDHLDRHGTMENYAAIKERLVAGASTPVVSIDDEHCRAIAERLRNRTSHEFRFSARGSELGGQGFAASGTRIVRIYSRRDGRSWLGDVGGLSNLRGQHNLQNALAAVAAVDLLDLAMTRRLENVVFERLSEELAGERKPVDLSSHDPRWIELKAIVEEGHDLDRWLVRADLFQSALRTFPGLPHRMEEVGRLGRAIFVNDSKATNADSAEKALASFERVLWILGGKPKEGGIEMLRPYFPKVDRAYLIGEAADEFAGTLGEEVPYLRCGTLDNAVAAAATDAARSTADEPVVLLSPACASYDQFKNFEERGNHFRDLIRALPGIEVKGL
jgi:UDP-N-acetylmuramoylalanine--D-glutamate ligase